MKMTALYYSKTGNTKEMAETIVRGMLMVDGVEAKAFSIEEIDENWLKESRGVVVGSPIYMAGIALPLVQWLQTECRKYGLAGKVGGAFATANYLHGGGELGLRTILDNLLVYGMLAYSGGGALGNPVIHLGPVSLAGKLEESAETAQLYGQRMAAKTVELFQS